MTWIGSLAPVSKERPSDALPDGLRRQVEAWIAADPDPATRAELEEMLARRDATGLAARFSRPLRFGTAGLRARLGAGPARMNRLVVRRTTTGLAAWVGNQGPGAAEAGVVIGRDARHGSEVFAADAAEVAAARGLRVHPFARPLPTPLTAFAVRHLGAAAGVMVTASHNPAPDNGYKLYVSDGAQVIPPDDAAVAEAAAAAEDVPVGSPPRRPGAVGEPIDTAVMAAYGDMALGLLDPAGPRELRVVYTPMHGVGGAVLPDLLTAAGFERPVLVTEQAAPDPEFPTLPRPNPEEPGALDPALSAARSSGADLVLANDPDADRLAVAVADRGGGWRTLTGDELGILLAEHRLGSTSGPGRLVATTIVSSQMLSKLAAEAGVAYEETLTGFKWIARAARRRPGHRLVFGYEEALGYAVTDAVADKDGLTAALLAAELAARGVADGWSLLDRLDALEARLGVHRTAQWTRYAEEPDAAEELAGIVASWRRQPPEALGGLAVTEVVDYAHGVDGLPPTDAVAVRLGTAARVVLRPSGTEPKMKVYLEVVTAPPGTARLAAARQQAARLLEVVTADVADRC